jgi:hypothetical protein
MIIANDNHITLTKNLDRAVPGQALTIRQPHRKFGQAYAEFVGHVGDGKHVLVKKLISSMYRARWTKPLRVARADVIEVADILAKR